MNKYELIEESGMGAFVDYVASFCRNYTEVALNNFIECVNFNEEEREQLSGQVRKACSSDIAFFQLKKIIKSDLLEEVETEDDEE